MSRSFGGAPRPAHLAAQTTPARSAHAQRHATTAPLPPCRTLEQTPGRNGGSMRDGLILLMGERERWCKLHGLLHTHPSRRRAVPLRGSPACPPAGVPPSQSPRCGWRSRPPSQPFPRALTHPRPHHPHPLHPHPSLSLSTLWSLCGRQWPAPGRRVPQPPNRPSSPPQRHHQVAREAPHFPVIIPSIPNQNPANYPSYTVSHTNTYYEP